MRHMSGLRLDLDQLGLRLFCFLVCQELCEHFALRVVFRFRRLLSKVVKVLTVDELTEANPCSLRLEGRRWGFGWGVSNEMHYAVLQNKELEYGSLIPARLCRRYAVLGREEEAIKIA